MNKITSPHIPVLLDEVLACFSGLSGVLVDCTLGFGGHSGALLESNENLSIIACDQDENALKFCQKRFENEIKSSKMRIIKSNFADIFPACFASLKKDEKIIGVLADIGVSSPQLDLDERGFALSSNELDMRMDTSKEPSAKDIVNTYAKSELERVFKDFGELKMAGAIADKIIKARAKAQITSAKELANIIGNESLKGRSVSIAKLVFQALRIEVNNELGVLKTLLDKLELHAKAKEISGAKVAIIAFHSLEDRIIKERFKLWSQNCLCDSSAFRCTCGANNALGRIISKKPLQASASELKANPRANCAKMRIFEFK